MSIELLAVLLILLLVVLFVGGIQIISILLISRDTTRIPEIISRLSGVEAITRGLAADIEMGVDGLSSNELWRSADGKYTAGSFEELLNMVASDPAGPLSADEISAIKSIFEKIMKSPLDDGDDDVNEPWKL